MADDSVAPDLLRRLAEHAARMDALAESSVATVTAEIVEKDGHGKVLHTIHSVAEIRRAVGQRVTHVLSATRDGHEYRAEAQRRATAEDRREKRVESPFATSNRGRYEFHVLGADSQEPRCVRIAVGPADEQHAATDILRGIALVDPEAGECVRLEGAASRNPLFVDHSSLTFDYLAMTPRGRMLSRVAFSFAGGLLLVRRQGEGILHLEYAHP